MLKDARSHALVENFAGQWLELRKLESVKPDRRRFPDFDEYLRTSMRRETELFFEGIVHEDRSILDFIDADYTFINERLANLYKISNVKGPDFRKVVLTSDTQRGGVLTQAGILTISSYATRRRGVARKWLEKNPNAPPPPQRRMCQTLTNPGPALRLPAPAIGGAPSERDVRFCHTRWTPRIRSGKL